LTHDHRKTAIIDVWGERRKCNEAWKPSSYVTRGCSFYINEQTQIVVLWTRRVVGM